MTASIVDQSSRLSLCEALDRLLETGVAAEGGVVISVADVDLIFLKLRLVLSSVEPEGPAWGPRLEGPAGGRGAASSEVQGQTPRAPQPVSAGGANPPPPRRSDSRKGEALPKSRRDAKQGLGQLVLALVRLLHELLERQAIRRMEAEALTSAQVEQLGLALMKQAEEIEALCEEFGLSEEDLNLDLGPLGRLF